MPAVGFQLGFTGAARPDRRAPPGRRLAYQMGPHTGQTREQILILRQLNLEPAFTGPRSSCKNIQDQTGAVQHLDAEFLGKYPHLRRGQFVVKDGHITAVHGDQLLHLGNFPVADKASGFGSGPVLDQRDHRFTAGCLHEGGKLIHGTVRRTFPGFHALSVQPG